MAYWKSIQGMAALVAAFWVFGNSPCAKAKGGWGSEGGDCVNIGDSCIPRDLLYRKDSKTPFVPVTQEKKLEFLNSIPGFVDLIKDLGAVDPGLALDIWNDWLSVKLYLVDWDLDVLPNALTSISKNSHADEQVCIRGSYDVICSTTAMAHVPAELRIIYPLHESLHSMVEGEGPIKHEKVRSFAAYLVANQGHYNGADIRSVMAGMDVRNHLEDYRKFEDPYFRTVQILFSEKGSFQARCELLNLLKEGEYQREDANFDLNTSIVIRMFLRAAFYVREGVWGNYSACQPHGLFTSFYGRHPSFKEYADRYEAGVPGVVKVYANDSYLLKKYCKENGDPKLKDSIDRFQAILKRAKEEKEKILAETSADSQDPSIDPAVAVYDRILALGFSARGYYGRFDLVESRLKEERETLDSNIAICTTYGNRSGFEKFMDELREFKNKVF